MRNKKDEIKKQYYVTDASDYEDMQELLVASDILISDYSSVITEFGLMKKPIFFVWYLFTLSHNKNIISWISTINNFFFI